MILRILGCREGALHTVELGADITEDHAEGDSIRVWRFGLDSVWPAADRIGVIVASRIEHEDDPEGRVGGVIRFGSEIGWRFRIAEIEDADDILPKFFVFHIEGIAVDLRI